jgi:hypothetical protein
LSLAAAGECSAASDAAALPWLVINRHSFRASRGGLAARAAALARSHGLPVAEAVNAEEFHATLDRLRQLRVQQLWVLAGDGTVHAIAQYLASQPGGGWSPALLLLGGGRANIVPRDCGGYPPWSSLQAALQNLRAGRAMVEESLPTLCVEQDGSPAQHGFLLAGAVIYAGVRLCREHRSRGRSWLHRSWIADPYVLLKLAVQVWLGRSPLPSAYDDMHVKTSVAVLRAPMRVVLATSLQLRAGLYNPFAKRGAGAVRLTAVAATARHFWRHLPAILMGRFGAKMNLVDGYLSGRFDSAEVLGLDGYALDGELFTTDPARPVRIGSGIALRVLRP